ncbi:MAG: ATP-binding cassette domain-containing protein [Elainellaceae cyanobacterium]
MVFQHYSLLPWLAALEIIDLAINLAVEVSFSSGSQSILTRSKPENRAVVRGHLAVVELADGIHKKPPQLSSEMRQQPAIARALAVHPEVLIFDELFCPLDAITKEKIQQELPRLESQLSTVS